MCVYLYCLTKQNSECRLREYQLDTPIRQIALLSTHQSPDHSRIY